MSLGTLRRVAFPSAIGLIVLLAFANRTIYSEQPQAGLSGMKLYSPTRLEWLALQLEAGYRLKEGDVNLDFIPSPPDAIVVFVRYHGTTAASNVDSVAEMGAKFVKLEAANYGWSNWVKIKFDRQAIPEKEQ